MTEDVANNDIRNATAFLSWQNISLDIDIEQAIDFLFFFLELILDPNVFQKV